MVNPYSKFLKAEGLTHLDLEFFVGQPLFYAFIPMVAKTCKNLRQIDLKIRDDFYQAYLHEDHVEYQSSSATDLDSEHEQEDEQEHNEEHDQAGKQGDDSEPQTTQLEDSSEPGDVSASDDDSAPDDNSELDQNAVPVWPGEREMISFFTQVTDKTLSLVGRYRFNRRNPTTRGPGAIYSWSEPSRRKPVS